MKVYLVRHGQTIMNVKNLFQGWSDGPLTEDGIEKAYLMGEYLNDVRFDAAVSSDLRRAKETCEYILSKNNHFKGDVFLNPTLREMNFKGTEADNVQDVWKQIIVRDGIKDFDALTMIERMSLMHQPHDPLSPEPFSEFETRVLKGFESIVDEARANGTENLLIVSHGVTIATILNEIMSSSTLKTSLPNASLCIFEATGDILVPETIGFTPWES